MVPGWLAEADDLIQALIGLGYRPTAQRHVIACRLVASVEPIAVGDLLAEVRLEFPSFTATTLRRNLQQWTKLDLIERTWVEDGRPAYVLHRPATNVRLSRVFAQER